MKSILFMAGAAMLTAALGAEAAIVGSYNWADRVEGHSGLIQNYAGTLITPGTEFWLTGPGDADADSNGYAWDPGDPDYVGGWRSNAPSEFIIMQWDQGIPDLIGNDLIIRLYSGPSASANVLASVDGTVYEAIGTIGGGASGYLSEVAFDFGGLLSGDARYIRVERVGNGPQTGMFFDAFAGVVPEPASLTLLGCGLLFIFSRHRRAY